MEYIYNKIKKIKNNYKDLNKVDINLIKLPLKSLISIFFKLISKTCAHLFLLKS